MIKKLASIQFFFVLAVTLMASMVIGTLIPQNQAMEQYAKFLSPAVLRLFKSAGFLDLYHSYWFVGLLALLGFNTSACIYMRVKEMNFKQLPWGALLSHSAFILILLGGVISGIWGEKGVLEMRVGESNCCVNPASSGNPTIHLPFQIRLAKFDVEYYNSGQHFIQVNHIKEGWRETVEVSPSKEYKVRDKVQLNVLRYVPDFRVEKDSAGKWKTLSASNDPNNPALEVEVTASPTQRVWLFAKYPALFHLHDGIKGSEKKLDLLYQFVPGKIKQFKSKIEAVKDSQVLSNGETSVNHPFKFGGYTFYQSGYNPEDPNYSSFQVSKDPGVPVVYAGFFLLPLGLTLSLWRKK